MSLILFYDTETTGLPDWQSPSDAEHQPHLVQLAAILADDETREEIAYFDVIVKPDNWEIPVEVSAIHGIDNDKAKKLGISESLAAELLIGLWCDNSRKRVAYNKVFDQRIIRMALKRYMDESISEMWADKESHHCAMMMYQQVFGGKRVKLSEAYKRATGRELDGAHNAMADTRACMEVYWYLLDKQQESNPFKQKEKLINQG